MKAAIEAIEEGKTENDVAAESYRAMTATGGEVFCNSPIVTAGYNRGWRTPLTTDGSWSG